MGIDGLKAAYWTARQKLVTIGRRVERAAMEAEMARQKLMTLEEEEDTVRNDVENLAAEVDSTLAKSM